MCLQRKSILSKIKPRESSFYVSNSTAYVPKCLWLSMLRRNGKFLNFSSLYGSEREFISERENVLVKWYIVFCSFDDQINLVLGVENGSSLKNLSRKIFVEFHGHRSFLFLAVMCRLKSQFFHSISRVFERFTSLEESLKESLHTCLNVLRSHFRVSISQLNKAWARKEKRSLAFSRSLAFTIHHSLLSSIGFRILSFFLNFRTLRFFLLKKPRP